jgi:enamine deaminase RidA (YjgF/YER057c/UK114 family)
MHDLKILLDPAGDDFPIAEAVIRGDDVFLSGFVGYSRETNAVVEGGLAEQTRQTLALIDEVLERAGTSRDRLVRMRVYLSHVRRDFAEFNAIFKEWIGDHRCARTTIGSELAEEGLLVEIDAQATL